MALHSNKLTGTVPSSRLASLIQRLQVSTRSVSPGCFAEQLGRRFGIADAINLDAALKTPCPSTTAAASTTPLADQVMEARHLMVRTLAASFARQGDGLAIKLPVPKIVAQRVSFAPYRDFYLAQQRQLSAAVRHLRTQLRQQLSSRSATLAQLARLDEAFEDNLANHSRDSFAVLPQLLEQHFRQQPQDTVSAQQLPPWLDRFHQDMQQLLLAELDIRLEPVLGLLEASQTQPHINEEHPAQ